MNDPILIFAVVLLALSVVGAIIAVAALILIPRAVRRDDAVRAEVRAALQADDYEEGVAA